MIYFIEAVGADRIKIGFTEEALPRRLNALKTGSCFPLKVLATCDGSMALERRLHKIFTHSRVTGEWFKAAPYIRALADDLSNGTPGAIERAEKAAGDEWTARSNAATKYVERSKALLADGLKAFVAKHGVDNAAKASRSDVSTVRGWLRGRSRMSFDRIVSLVRADREVFAAFIEHTQPTVDDRIERIERIERELAAIRREAA